MSTKYPTDSNHLGNTSGNSPPSFYCSDCDATVSRADGAPVNYCKTCRNYRAGQAEAMAWRERFLAGAYDQLSRTPHLRRIKFAVADGEFVLNHDGVDAGLTGAEREFYRISWFHYERIITGLLRGDVAPMMLVGSHRLMSLVVENMELLLDLGLWERALLGAYVGTKQNLHGWDLSYLRRLWDQCTPSRLRALAPLPGPGPFTLYRGVAGTGSRRKVRGISWTGTLDVARSFASSMSSLCDLKDPAIYSVRVKDDDVLAYTDDRDEDEYIVLLRPSTRIRRLDVQPFTEAEHAERRKRHWEMSLAQLKDQVID